LEPKSRVSYLGKPRAELFAKSSELFSLSLPVPKKIVLDLLILEFGTGAGAQHRNVVTNQPTPRNNTHNRRSQISEFFFNSVAFRFWGDMYRTLGVIYGMIYRMRQKELPYLKSK